MSGFRVANIIVLLGSLAVLGGALLFQYAGGLQPCELCLLERWPYYIAIPLALVALAAASRRVLATIVIALLALLFVASAGLGAYHVGVEHHWVAGPTACTGGSSRAQTVEELKAQLFGQKPVQCDQVQWSVFGVSLAGFNLLASVGLAVIAFAGLGARRRWRR
jgi:disulfide bond formation protein DsbB